MTNSKYSAAVLDHYYGPGNQDMNWDVVSDETHEELQDLQDLYDEGIKAAIAALPETEGMDARFQVGVAQSALALTALIGGDKQA